MKGLIVAITGASGIIYALRLLENVDLLKGKYGRIEVIVSSNAVKVAKLEMDIEDLAEYIRGEYRVDKVYGEDEWLSIAASSSGLVGYDMVIVPASLNTIAKIASGVQDNIILRAANSILRLRNKLVVVVRETPLSTIDLYNLYKLSSSGAVVMPASPGFYHRPKTIDELINFIVGKILDVLGVENRLYRHWGGNMDSQANSSIS